MKNNKILNNIELIFLVFSIIFGCLIIVLTPPLSAPDETAHALRTCEVADRIFYNKIPAHNVDCDKFLSKLNIERPNTNHQATGYSPILYLFSATGFNLGKIWGGYTMFYLGRIFNLISWIIMMYYAIKITPVFKYMFFFSALLPMSIYEGASLAADSVNNAFSFLFFAYIFKLLYKEKHIKVIQTSKLFVLSLISSFLKGAIYPTLLFFVLPIKKYKYFFASITLLLSTSLMLLWNNANIIYTHPDINLETQKLILLNNPLEFISLFFKSMAINSVYYIKNIIGIFGNLDVRLNIFVYIATTLVFISSFFILPEEKIRKKHKILALISLFIIMLCINLMYYLIWVHDDFRIRGIQGRYFIPFLPFFFLALSQKYKKIQINENHYKLFIIIFSFILLVYSCFVLYNAY